MSLQCVQLYIFLVKMAGSAICLEDKACGRCAGLSAWSRLTLFKDSPHKMFAGRMLVSRPCLTPGDLGTKRGLRQLSVIGFMSHYSCPCRIAESVTPKSATRIDGELEIEHWWSRHVSITV